MIRTQIQLEEETFRALQVLAKERQCSFSELVRTSVKNTLQTEDRMTLKKRGLEVAGKFRSGLGDLAKNHDTYLNDGF